MTQAAVPIPVQSFRPRPFGLAQVAYRGQLAVQQQYGFTISDEDAHHITTVGQALEYTNRRLQE